MLDDNPYISSPFISVPSPQQSCYVLIEILELMHTIVLKENFAVAHRELGRVCLELEENTKWQRSN